MQYHVSLNELSELALTVASRINKEHPGKQILRVHGVPRGGIPAALAIGGQLIGTYGKGIVLEQDPQKADIIVDDLIDSGSTSLLPEFRNKPFYALIDKRDSWQHHGRWIVWPWEETAESGIENNIIRLIQYAGDDPTRGGLIETPKRVAKAWKFWCSGYDRDPADILKTFQDGAEGVDEMVVVKDIPFYTHCEHHMAPFFGTATIAYLPNGRVVGLSKLSRLLDIFARRLQVQERLTGQVADALMEHLEPLGCGVVLKARHMCMESRGVSQQGSITITSALRGVFKEDVVRAEFLALAR